ncbi:glycosyltransferase [Hyphobacterium sp. CCMP332]|nr:glycosyltransferase [Hyphobacterium sp. CCMP332]
MKIAYLSYWGIEDGLTKASVFPNIEILASFHEVSEIFLFTIERSEFEIEQFKNQKIIHVPLVSTFRKIRFLNKLSDFLKFPLLINRRIQDNGIDVLICRGAPAGALALSISKNSNVPFIVESFEPHAEYMLESKVWSKYSLSYILEKRWEQRIKNQALALLPVSINYQKKLIEEGIKRDVYLAPCAVDHSEFEFNSEMRDKTRLNLKIDKDKKVGIYVGKFGDIYLKEEFFELIKELKNHLKDQFYFIILSPMDKSEIMDLLKRHKINFQNIAILKVDHHEVPNYLSAADYGLVTVRPSPHRKYCSPIKTGEYWANGLPVLITEDIGDDSRIITEKNVGSIIDLNDLKHSVEKFMGIFNSKNRYKWAEQIMPLAKTFRGFDFTIKAYQNIIQKIEKD